MVVKTDELELRLQLSAENVRDACRIPVLVNIQRHGMAVIVNLQWSREGIVKIDELNGRHVVRNGAPRVNGDR